jgi:hypothetical protein
VHDTTPPSITCPPDMTFATGGACTAVTLSCADLGRRWFPTTVTPPPP